MGAAVLFYRKDETMRSLLSLFLVTTSLFAADAKWMHLTSAHFDVYTSESEGDTKAAITHLEAARAFFLAATHSHDPAGQSVRIVIFHAESDYSKYKPADVHTAKVFSISPGTIVADGLKADMDAQVFREYAQLSLDDSGPTLPYWFRYGLATVYSTLKASDAGMTIGSAPKSDYRNGEVGDVSLPLLFTVNRETMLASREKASLDFNSDVLSTGTNNGASSGSRNPGGSASTALGNVQSALSQSQDFARASWMLVHMLMFQQDYRPKFGEFMRTLASGTESGAAFEKVYSSPVSKVKTDLTIYSKQTGILTMTAPFKVEKLAAPESKPLTTEALASLFASLK
jgi:hypothetical protein